MLFSLLINMTAAPLNLLPWFRGFWKSSHLSPLLFCSYCSLLWAQTWTRTGTMITSAERPRTDLPTCRRTPCRGSVGTGQLRRHAPDRSASVTCGGVMWIKGNSNNVLHGGGWVVAFVKAICKRNLEIYECCLGEKFSLQYCGIWHFHNLRHLSG